MSYVSSYTKQMIDYMVRYFGNSAKSYYDDVIHCYKEEEIRMGEEDSVVQIRYQHLFQVLDSDILILMLHLVLAQYEWQNVGTMIKELTGSGVTIRLALDLLKKENVFSSGRYQPEKEQYDELELYRQYRKISKLLCEKKNSGSFLDTVFEADERLYLYVRGSNETAAGYGGVFWLYAGEQNYCYFGQDKAANKLAQYLKRYDTGGYETSDYDTGIKNNTNQRTVYMQLSGEYGSGRKSLVKKAADRAEYSVVYLDFQRLLTYREEQRQEILHSVKRELIFYNAALCIHNIEDEKNESRKDTDRLLYLIEGRFKATDNPVIIITLTETEIIPHTELAFIKMELDCRELSERIKVWEMYAAMYHIEIDSHFYGVKYTLTPSQTAKVFLLLSQMTDSGDSIDEKICRCCREVIPMPEKGSVCSVTGSRRLSDLKLSGDKKEQLNAICSYMRSYYKVYRSWNMDSRYSYGKGMTALFTGMPGTGKTMAAECIAGELGIPLYKVDLSQIVDKYIGETEKKLEKVFRYAQSANVILFFDEADALFGKRSEVKDSKDKYANTEVSYILQRIEQYDGMVILASNFIRNIDEAFMRRMKYVVEFEMPGSGIRKEIWKSGFSEEIPAEDIDYDFLAQTVELSGGHIKNIIINAAFLAAGDSTPVTMTHILKSTQNEYYKLGKRLNADSFGEYAFCITDK